MSSYNDTLSATSSLVLLWEGGEIHTSKLSQQYRKLISLSAGKPLFDRCNLVWVNYDQVIKNRKNCILNIVNNVLSNCDTQQVVLLGSGLDSLSFEILSRFNSVTIFEADKSNMELKSQHIQEIEPSLLDNIKCINFDFSFSKGLVSSLENYGFSKNEPTLIVAEGLSHYMQEKKFWDVIKKFQTSNQQNNFILEYLVPKNMISKNRVEIPNKIFKIIGFEFGLEIITTYSMEDIQNRISDWNGKIIANYNMMQMEKQRTGENQYFKEDKSGWTEICHAMI